MTFGARKSRSFRHVASLDPVTVQLLAAHLAGDRRRHGRPGVYQPARRAAVPDRFRARVWLPALKASGLDQLQPRPSFHSLRHSHVAALIAYGAPMKAVQARLGHGSMRIAYDRYGHLEE